MAYKALIAFSGIISMEKGEVRDISDLAVAYDLLKAGYIERIKETAEEKNKKKKTKRKGRA